MNSHDAAANALAPASYPPAAFDRTAWWKGLANLPLAMVLLPTLGLGCLIGLFATVNELTDLGTLYVRPGAWVAGVLATCLSIALIAWIGKRVPEGRIGVAIGATVAASILLHALYAMATDEPLRGDFLAMWVAAGEMAAGGLPHDPTIYHWRALPLLVPAVLLFGAQLAIVPTLNIVLLAATQIMGCLLLFQSGRRRAALVFALIFAVVPETYHASVVTSHDIWGLFFLVLVIFLGVHLQRRIVSPASARPRFVAVSCLLAAALVIAVALLDLQRQIGLVVILGSGIYVSFTALGWVVSALGRNGRGNERRRFAAAAVLLATSVAGVALMGWTSRITGLEGNPTATAMREHRVVAANGSSLGTGYYSWLHRLETDYLAKLEPTPESWKEFSRSLVLSDFASQPLARAHSHLFRLYRQFDLGSNYRFYLMRMHKEQRNRYWVQRIWNVSFAASFCLAVGLALVRTLGQARPWSPLVLQLGLLGALLLLLDGVGESQPRYIFPIWFVGAQLIAVAITSIRDPLLQGTWRRGVLLSTLAISTGVALAACAWFTLDRTYGAPQGRIIHGWEFDASGGTNDAKERAALRKLQQTSGRNLRSLTTHNPDLALLGNFGTHAAVLKFETPLQQGARLTALSQSVCGSKEHDSALAFFVAADKGAGDRPNALLRVGFGDNTVFEMPLPADADVSHHSIPGAIAAGACGRVRVELVATTTTRSTRAMRLSRVEVQFLRLIPQP